jgi:tetratricopeptide (TPR) repeat protein
LSFGASVAVLGLLGMTSAFAQTDACGTAKISKKLEKPLGAVQTARAAKDWNGMLAKVQEAEAVPIDKSEYDKYWFHEYRGIAYTNLKQFPEAGRELEAAYSSPCFAEVDKPGRQKMLMQIAYQNKDYPKAIEYGKQVYASTPDADSGVYLGNAYYITNDFENTRKVLADVVSKLEASGKTPEEQTYRILQSACLNLKDNACVVDQMEKLVLHYPKPNYWQDLTNAMMRTSASDKELLNIFRLSDGVGVLKEASGHIEMAQLALGAGLPGEAQTAIEKGLQEGAFTAQREKDLANRVLAEAKTAVTLDKSTLDKQDASARAKPTGDSDVKLGAAYLSYGQNDKAVEALQRGIAKGGVKNPDEAGLLLGIAYVRSNNKPEASKAFGTVTKDPAMARIAKMWLLYTSGGAGAG